MSLKMNSKRSVALVALMTAAVTVSGCSTVSKLNPFDKSDENKSTASQGQRISIIAFDQKVEASESLKGADFFLPDPVVQTEWRLPGGNPEQSIEHVDAGKAFQIAWKKGFGKKGGAKFHVTAPPVASGDRIFVMDGEADVVAMDARTGDTIWRQDLRPAAGPTTKGGFLGLIPKKNDRLGFGGGVALGPDNKLYVASGFRFVAQIDAATGAMGWTQPTSTPIHAAPTVVDGRVFVVSTDNELLTFASENGVPGWTYQALSEPARILAASTPAVSGDTVVSGFASGELVALRAANGNDLWNEALSRASRTNALSEIRDIPGRPVIYKGDVFAVSHSGVFAATDLRSGQARWSLPVTAITTPWAAGDVVYVVDKSGQVICVSRESGSVYWIQDLNDSANLSKKQKKKRAKKPRLWSTPILANGRLITVSSEGEAVALNAKTGAKEKTLKIGSPVLLNPIAVGDMIYLVTDDAELIAVR
ncbi:PQQ-like beta-propeller repeat protein [Caulobacter vibrioides]|uniref:PQQ enzyme repeat family protein n=2 Tax=Caulobacter vibrioides TaxID=155892 RepID=Q9A7R7_CAUVC|nr:PQQ-like beta-propeller repeat protein [Caulobacter vibrioides]YP_002517098.1 beta-barrel assembly machine (BAM) protein BamB [Caulobacter vibrioides NA1000]QBQ57093.1 dehydrogenase [synthetic Caulobacter sp. 'ethensis']AAK23631.1 PQQ enzyme repeat family protein [Caulobacter vibrioides CB15]ACL95190.1 beta-barrel assembly machine (BAM) protein BamB [Caulobacter vibrioides NA1000]ATC28535.1 dehydrogenase [Caulobacter vibrioides]QXZ53717.1 PQQ-like beta-propeller repeat protein [Caulobacter